MSWINLRVEILEEFAEAAVRGCDHHERHLRAWEARRLRELENDREWEETSRQRLRLQVRRCAVRHGRCSCGGVLEFREGCPQPIHLGRCTSRRVS